MRENQGPYQAAYTRGQDTGLHANLDVVCSMKAVTVGGAWTAVRGVGYAGGFHNGKAADGKPSFDAPGTMFEIIRRNYLYHVSLLAFEPEKRIRRNPGGLNEADSTTLLMIMSQPLVIFTECFSEVIRYGNEIINAGTAKAKQASGERGAKRLEEIFELGCPMYVCAFVATLLHQMWSNRLINIRGLPAASATSAWIVKQTITVEERAKLSSGLVKILGRMLPSFWNMQRSPRGHLSFRDFLKGVNSRGSHEAKKLANLEKACRWIHPAPAQGTSTGGATIE